MTSEPAIGPCPQCGGETEIRVFIHPATGYVQHVKCGFKGPELMRRGGVSDDDLTAALVRAWNSPSC
jgi:hypothetical protein